MDQRNWPAASLAGRRAAWYDALILPEPIPMTATTVRAVCPHDCPDTCGMVVTVRDGRAVDLRGDPDHPFTRGFLCQKVARYLERVYHADRLQYPQRRIGPKGPGTKFERITWEAATAAIADHF